MSKRCARQISGQRSIPNRFWVVRKQVNVSSLTLMRFLGGAVIICLLYWVVGRVAARGRAGGGGLRLRADVENREEGSARAQRAPAR